MTAKVLPFRRRMTLEQVISRGLDGLPWELPKNEVVRIYLHLHTERGHRVNAYALLAHQHGAAIVEASVDGECTDACEDGCDHHVIEPWTIFTGAGFVGGRVIAVRGDARIAKTATTIENSIERYGRVVSASYLECAGARGPFSTWIESTAPKGSQVRS